MDFPLFKNFENQKLFEKRSIGKYEFIDSHLNKFIVRNILRGLLFSSYFKEPIFWKHNFSFIVRRSMLVSLKLIFFCHCEVNLIFWNYIIKWNVDPLCNGVFRSYFIRFDNQLGDLLRVLFLINDSHLFWQLCLFLSHLVRNPLLYDRILRSLVAQLSSSRFFWRK